ncbi:hypothetical protein [Nitrospirillum viridazoti]|uniref:Uncharacterized protein n=1 Tax=Nitrospirillum amazonense TaxID=28077 RepID=A0A560II47_9PROT|nr:hypothetical protein [Nitrospirillum amazonense]TWB58722.1 hypothetical protein FBZ92_109215 [Nitrospirillum amazonense]
MMVEGSKLSWISPPLILWIAGLAAYVMSTARFPEHLGTSEQQVFYLMFPAGLISSFAARRRPWLSAGLWLVFGLAALGIAYYGR